MVTPPEPACEGTSRALGAYVLGALSPDEAREVEAHLEGCPGCAATRDSLAAVVPHLASVDADEVERGPVEAGPELLDRLLARVAAERRTARRRRVLAVAAAVVVVVSGAGWATGVVGGDPSPGQVLVATDRRTGVSAEVTMRDVGWGAKVSLTLSGVPEGAHCRLDVIGPAGERETAASWRATYQGTANVDGGVAFDPADIRRLEVVTSDGSHLVTVRT